MTWDVEIEKAVNGYIAKWWEENDDASDTVRQQQVFEEQDSDRGELDAFASLVWFLAEHFGLYGSKHDHYRFRCEVVGQREGENADALCV